MSINDSLNLKWFLSFLRGLQVKSDVVSEYYFFTFFTGFQGFSRVFLANFPIIHLNTHQKHIFDILEASLCGCFGLITFWDLFIVSGRKKLIDLLRTENLIHLFPTVFDYITIYNWKIVFSLLSFKETRSMNIISVIFK